MLSPTVRLCFVLVRLLLLISVINGQWDELKLRLRSMHITNEAIDGLFRPFYYVGGGSYGIVFKGERTTDNRAVAMKFSLLEQKNITDREFEMYSYLYAINDTDIEKLGISPIFYYKEWDGYILTVFSLFGDGNLFELAQNGHFPTNGPKVINSLILFRDFVRQSKYLHSCGVRHDDIKPGNIMFRKHRMFLIDFNLSSKMNGPSLGGTRQYASRRYHNDEQLHALDDWESFLYTMCHVNDVQLDWFDADNFIGMDEISAFLASGHMKKRIQNTIKIINASIESLPLRIVYSRFITDVFKHPISVPRYDYLDKVINGRIKEVLESNEIATFTWLSHIDKYRGVEDSTDHPLSEIKSIKVPANFDNFEYPKVNLEFFSKPIASPSNPIRLGTSNSGKRKNRPSKAT